MSYLTSIFLGFIQGITEFLPVSSSGHLSILQNIFSMSDYEQEHMFFDVLLHFGTLISIFIVYWKDIIDMIREFFLGIAALFRRGDRGRIPPARRLVFMIIIATIPLLVVMPFKDKIESLYYNTTAVGVALLFTGALLFISDRAGHGKKNERSATMADTIIIGVAQAIAVIPGISRSGSTISAGLFRGMDRKFAVRFSFLLSIPAVLGANVISFTDAMEQGIDNSLLPVYLAGVASAVVFGYFAIRLIRYIADKGRFGGFAYYCWAVGAFAIIASFIV